MEQTFYDRVNAICQRKGITVAKLERDLGYGNATLSYYKKHNSVPKQARVKEIADYLDTYPEYLISGDTSGENSTGYYSDPAVLDMAKFLFENPQYRVLFDASRHTRPEDIELVRQLIDRINGTQDA